MFALASAYTIAIALSVIVAPDWASEAFYRHRALPEETVLRILAGDFGGCLLLFGILYGMVARDPSKNRAVVWVGAIGKTLVFASMTQRYLAGIATPLAFSAGIGDLIFAALFAHFLWRTRPSL